MLRPLWTVLAYCLLALCVLAGAASVAYLHWAVWAELAFAGLIGIGAGGLAPRSLPAWLATLVLVAPAWLATLALREAGAAIYLFPAAATAGAAAGVVAWRLPYARRFWRPVPLFAGAALVAVFALLAESWMGTGFTPPAFRPAKAPAYTLQMLDGGAVHSRDLRGRTVVLAFWATWCEPCREEMPGLQKLYERRYRNDPNVAFYLVDLGVGVDTRRRAKTYLEAHGVTIPAAYDADGSLMAAFNLPRELPTRVVISANGVLRYRAIGYGGYAKGFPKLRHAIAGAVSSAFAPPGSSAQ